MAKKKKSEKKKPERKKTKKNKIEIIRFFKYFFWGLFFVYGIFLCLVMSNLYVYSMTILYERIIILVLASFPFFFLLIDKFSGKKIELWLALAIVYLTITGIWTTFYENLPNIVMPSTTCPSDLKITSSNSVSFIKSIGNYGKIPAYLRFNRIISPENKGIKNIHFPPEGNVILPYQYNNNKQAKFTFTIELTDVPEKILYFNINYNMDSEDLVDRFVAEIREKKEYWQIVLSCKYELEEDTYVLKEYFEGMSLPCC